MVSAAVAAAVAGVSEVTIAVDLGGFVGVSNHSVEDHSRVPLGRSVLSIVPLCVLSRQRYGRMVLNWVTTVVLSGNWNLNNFHLTSERKRDNLEASTPIVPYPYLDSVR